MKPTADCLRFCAPKMPAFGAQPPEPGFGECLLCQLPDQANSDSKAPRNPQNSKRLGLILISLSDLSGGFFLATRINRDGAKTSAHVISLAMLAVHEGAELFASYEAALGATGQSTPDTSKQSSLN